MADVIASQTTFANTGIQHFISIIPGFQDFAGLVQESLETVTDLSILVYRPILRTHTCVF